MRAALSAAQQTRCQLSKAIVVAAGETPQHAAGPRASREPILTHRRRAISFPDLCQLQCLNLTFVLFWEGTLRAKVQEI